MTSAPRLHVVGLGPAGAELVTAGTMAVLRAAATVVVRTARHPAVEELGGPGGPLADAVTCDDLYESADRLADVYPAIVERVLGLAADADASAEVVYVVPGSPAVAEHTVELLRAAAAESSAVELVVHPALSFADLAWVRLGVDPLAAGVRIVDGQRFGEEAAGERGPLLVAQCDTGPVLSEIKLALEDGPTEPVVVLQRLGLPDERIHTVAWDDLDRSIQADHLTSLYLPSLPAPVGVAMTRLADLTHTLRARCPWDREQTHRSLVRHLVEEAYEVVEALEGLEEHDEDPDRAPDDAARYEHLAEELGDLLFQVAFHAELAHEVGAFDLAAVAVGVHDKLVARHPHVFGDAAIDTAAGVEANWERIKRAEKDRTSAMDGIPPALPALLLALKSHERAGRAGLAFPSPADALATVHEELTEVEAAVAAGTAPSGDAAVAWELGDLLLAAVGAAHELGVEPEGALRAAAARFQARFRAVEAASTAEGVPIAEADAATLDRWWRAAKALEPTSPAVEDGVPERPPGQQ